jgi:DUF4097 and DUF4098 domain-containing protein YvlB
LPVRAHTSNGAIHAEHIGPAELKTSNGSVHAAHIEGAATVETSNGSIELQDVAGDVRAQTSNGHLRAMGIRAANCMLHTSNGQIHYEAESEACKTDLHTSNGSIDIRLPAQTTADLRFQASLGVIRVTMPSNTIELEELGRTRYEGKLNGGGPPFAAATSNGSITLRSSD